MARLPPRWSSGTSRGPAVAVHIFREFLPFTLIIWAKPVLLVPFLWRQIADGSHGVDSQLCYGIEGSSDCSEMRAGRGLYPSLKISQLPRRRANSLSSTKFISGRPSLFAVPGVFSDWLKGGSTYNRLINCGSTQW